MLNKEQLERFNALFEEKIKPAIQADEEAFYKMSDKAALFLKGQEKPETESYIQSLENLLIYMCQTHEEWHEVLRKLAVEEDNKALLKVPMIQGSANRVPISQLAKMSFELPEQGFSEVHAEIQRKRTQESKEGGAE